MDEDFSADELKLAFSYHIVNQILGADGLVAPEEARFLEKSFPRSLLERSGFLQAGRFTRRWNEALGEALLQLPVLPAPERVRIIETFFRAALADDQFAWSEGDVMKRAARLLGLTPADYGPILDQLVTSEVTLETAED